MKVVLHPDALNDLLEARDWYNARAPGLGYELRDIADAMIRRIAEAPASFPGDPKRKWAHRARIRKFSYAVIFTIADDDSTVTILAFAHVKRRPSYWIRRRTR